MKKVVKSEIEDYVYQFYQMGATTLNTNAEELMEQALFMYAGIVADELNRSKNQVDFNYSIDS